MGNYPIKHDNKKNNRNNDLTKNDVLKGAGILAAAAATAYLGGKGITAAANAYNTKRKYDSIDNAVDKLFGNLPIIGGLFK